jgi:hypothetical protein
MTEHQFTENEFLNELLTLQQDGSGAISAPSNWIEEPLLSVETQLDQTIDILSTQLLSKSGENKKGVWWFLVGSPGNGKSAAVGRLVRNLRNKENAAFRLEKDSSGKLGQDILELGPTEIPYKVELYENKSTWATAWFAQDASVVTNPFAQDADPAIELRELLKNAEAQGVSLVVCANRGVLESAFEKSRHSENDQKTAWYKALEHAQKDVPLDTLTLSPSTRQPPFSQVKVEITPLDKESLLISGAFDKLVERAVREDNWKACSTCQSHNYCPFKQNRDWLVNLKETERLSEVVRIAELYSGQAIVFREAVALVSLLLAGNPRDYTNETPCIWVQKKHSQGAYFSLLAKRIYMVLFSAHSPYGLDFYKEDMDEQIGALVALAEQPDVQPTTYTAISSLGDKITTDVGLSRLLGYDGILTSLDPIKEGQGKLIEQKWDFSPGSSSTITNPLISDLESKCFEIWDDMEKSLEGYGNGAVDAYKHLRRWVTSVTYRLGFFAEGKLLFQDELLELNEIILSGSSGISKQQILLLKDLSKQLAGMLALTDSGIAISSFVDVSGDWISSNLKTKIEPNTITSNNLKAFIGGMEFEVPALVYIWLKRQKDTNLSKLTFPPEILQVTEDTRKRAATSSAYAFATDEIDLKIRLPAKQKFILVSRFTATDAEIKSMEINGNGDRS